MTSLILVADAGRAKFFSAADKHYELTELADFVHPVAVQDNPGGGTVAGHSGTRHGLEPRTLPKEHDLKAFAAELAKYVEEQFAKRDYSDLTLAAPPEFLGALRNALHRNTQKIVGRTIDKDLTHCTSAELSRALKESNVRH
ncbi:MAG TPA: host attachment protein [Spongiibacteraceae bacterium]|nr:host attachment protein [Spongiibacteraceae bacterium]